MTENLLHFWYQALSSPCGIEIEVHEFEPIRQKLYRARVEAADTDLEAIAICASPFDPMKLWLVKRKPSNEA